MILLIHLKSLSLTPHHGYVLIFPMFKGVTCHKAKSSYIEVYFWALFCSAGSLLTTLYQRKPTEDAKVPG